MQRSKVARKRSNYFRPEPVQSQSGNREAPASTFAQIEDIPVAEGKVAAKREMSDEQKFIANEPVAGEAQFLLEQRVADAPQPAEAFPRSDEVRMLNEPADVGVSGAEVADDAFAVMDTPLSPESADAIEAEEVIQSAIESSSDGRFGSAVRTESEPAEMRQFVDRDATGPSLEAEAMRDPAGWIEDVEKLLAEGRRDEAIASLESFRLDYPYYPLPEDLQNLLALEPE